MEIAELGAEFGADVLLFGVMTLLGGCQQLRCAFLCTLFSFRDGLVDGSGYPGGDSGVDAAVDIGLADLGDGLCRLCNIEHILARDDGVHKDGHREHGGGGEAKPGSGGPEPGEPTADGGGLEDLIRNEPNPLRHVFVAQGEEGGVGEAQGLQFGATGFAGFEVLANVAGLGAAQLFE